MAQKAVAKSKAQLLKEQKAQQATIKRANEGIRKILDDAGLMLTTPNVRIIHEDGAGRRVDGGSINLDALAAMYNMRPGTVIMPQVKIAVKPSPNGQHE
jgi:hypothetical protein